MRYSTQGRILAELALVRISRLENLDELSALIEQLRRASGTWFCPDRRATPHGLRCARRAAGSPTSVPPGSPAEKKDNEPLEDLLRASEEPETLAHAQAELETPARLRKRGTGNASPTCKRGTGNASPSASEGPETLAGSQSEGGRVRAAGSLKLAPANAAEVWNQTLSGYRASSSTLPGRFIRCRFRRPIGWSFASSRIMLMGAARASGPRTPAASKRPWPRSPASLSVSSSPWPTGRRPRPQPAAVPAHVKILEAAKNPLVRLAGELFGAQPMRVDDPPEKT